MSTKYLPSTASSFKNRSLFTQKKTKRTIGTVLNTLMLLFTILQEGVLRCFSKWVHYSQKKTCTGVSF